MKIGFGIVAHDKFEEVKLLSDIIKSFGKEYYVLACSNHPDGEKELSDYANIDQYISGPDLPFDPKAGKSEKGGNLLRLMLRVVSNYLACNMALIDNSELDYCVFLHSDSWFFDIQKIKDIISDLKKSDKKLAVRSIGFGCRTQTHPFGKMGDMYMIYERSAIKSAKVFDFDPMQMYPHVMDTHGMISSNVFVKLGISKVMIHSNPSRLYFWKSKYLTEKTFNFRLHNFARPSIYDPKLKFAHVERNSFPDNLGLHMQAYYLDLYKMKGPTIDEFVSKWKLTEKDLFGRVKRIDQKTKRLLARHLMTYRMFGIKDFNIIKKFYDTASTSQKIYRTIRAIIWAIIRKTITTERVYNILYGFRFDFHKYYSKNIHDPEIYAKKGYSIWYKDYKE